jgi:acylphosphatase
MIGAIRRRVVATGRVQGVFFRDTAKRRADAVGVSGWVANRADGAVEAVFEGDPEAVEEMVEFCRSGPGGAVVDEVEVRREEPEGLDRFEIR